MSWPAPQDYNEAVQNPSSCFRDSELRKGTPALNALGLPRSDSGTFASVYRLQCGGRDWAVRCFLSDVPGQESRYRALTDFIGSDDLDCTVGFEYLKEGILVHSRWYPAVKMEWVSGESLTTFVERNLENPAVILKFAETFKTMTVEMQAAGVAHGDLQHGNLLVIENDQIRLVDYDGMYVPQMATTKSNELGHPNYQHPERNAGHFGIYLDNFSAWVIYMSLRFIARDKSLWNLLQGGDECLLLRRRDFQAPKESPAIQMLMHHIAADVRQGANILLTLLELDPAQVPPLSLANSSAMKLIDVHAPSWFERLAAEFHHWSEGALYTTEIRAPLIHWTTRVVHKIEQTQPSKANPAQGNKMPALPEWLVDYLGSESDYVPDRLNQNFPAKVRTAAPPASGVTGPVTIAAHTLPKSGAQVTAANLTGAIKTINELLGKAAAAGRNKQYEQSIAFLTKAMSVAALSSNTVRQMQIAHELAVMHRAQADTLVHNHKVVSAAWAYEQAYSNLRFEQTLRLGVRDKNDDILMAAVMEEAARCYALDGKFDLAKKHLETACTHLIRYPDQAPVVKMIRDRQSELP